MGAHTRGNGSPRVPLGQEGDPTAWVGGTMYRWGTAYGLTPIDQDHLVRGRSGMVSGRASGAAMQKDTWSKARSKSSASKGA
jgi:hypothetical protein